MVVIPSSADLVFDMLSSGSMIPDRFFRDWDRKPDCVFLFEFLGRMPYLVVMRVACFGESYRLVRACISFRTLSDAVEYAQRREKLNLRMMRDGVVLSAREYDVYDCTC